MDEIVIALMAPLLGLLGRLESGVACFAETLGHMAFAQWFAGRMPKQLDRDLSDSGLARLTVL